MSIDPEAVKQELQNPPPRTGGTTTAGASAPAGPAPTPGGAPTPTPTPPPGPAPAPGGPAPAGPAPGGPAPGGPAPGGPAPGGPAPAGPGAPAPAPASPQAMSLATAQTLLTNSYGDVREIVPGNITIVDTYEALCQAYDDDCIARGVTFDGPGGPRPWRRGDCAAEDARLNVTTQGFAVPGTTRVYVLKTSTLPTVTAHELLHANTAPGFRAAVGEATNEGATEYLALKALTDGGVSTAGGVAYPDQVAAVRQLVALVGESALIGGYFNTERTLITAFEAVTDTAFSRLKGAGTLDTGHMAALLVQRDASQKAASIRTRLRNDPFTETHAEAVRAIVRSNPLDLPALRNAVRADIIAAINNLLDGWVSGEDIESIRRLCHLPVADLAAISAAIEPRVTELTSIGQRTQLRLILVGG